MVLHHKNIIKKVETQKDTRYTSLLLSGNWSCKKSKRIENESKTRKCIRLYSYSYIRNLIYTLTKYTNKYLVGSFVVVLSIDYYSGKHLQTKRNNRERKKRGSKTYQYQETKNGPVSRWTKRHSRDADRYTEDGLIWNTHKISHRHHVSYLCYIYAGKSTKQNAPKKPTSSDKRVQKQNGTGPGTEKKSLIYTRYARDQIKPTPSLPHPQTEIYAEP